MKILILLLSIFLLDGCFDNDTTSKEKNTIPQQRNIQIGKIVFSKNCTVCHGNQGEGLVKNWKQKQANGHYPPPPLNGTAHTWHHSPAVLLDIINNGGAKFKGYMPPFKGKITEDEMKAILDYLYSIWPRDIQKEYSLTYKK